MINDLKSHFKPGQIVYCLSNGKIIKVKVKEVRFDSEGSISYVINEYARYEFDALKHFFSSRQELVDHLLNTSED